METFSTPVGNFVKESVVDLGTTPYVKDGYSKDYPKLHSIFARRVDDNGWDLLFENGGDWFGVYQDDNTTAQALGMIDDAITSKSEQLRNGAKSLRRYAEIAREETELENQDSLKYLASYLEEKAEDAEKQAARIERGEEPEDDED